MSCLRTLGLFGLFGLLALALTAAVPTRVAGAQDASPAATPIVVSDGCLAARSMAEATPAVDAAPDIDPTTLDLDVLYIDVMIPHHEMAVLMAGIAQERSTRPEVVSLAASIVETQSRELEQLRAWRAAWYPDIPALSESQVFAGLETKAANPGLGGVPGLPELAMAGMAGSLAALCEETEQFDLAFINAMVEHHTGAVLISELVAEEAIHPELKPFAQTVVDTQGAEIATMLEWRDIWFGDVPDDHHGGDEPGTPSST